MQIHDLNTKALTDPAYVPFDDGTDTYKAEFNSVVADAAAAAVADADLTENEVTFTSGDAASPTAWTSVSVLTSGSTLATLFKLISTMVKNVRWLYSATTIFKQYQTSSFAALDTILTTGSSPIPFIADVADTSTDKPDSGNHFIVFGWINGSKKYGCQLVVSFGANSLYLRRRNNSTTWSSWATIS